MSIWTRRVTRGLDADTVKKALIELCTYFHEQDNLSDVANMLDDFDHELIEDCAARFMNIEDYLREGRKTKGYASEKEKEEVEKIMRYIQHADTAVREKIMQDACPEADATDLSELGLACCRLFFEDATLQAQLNPQLISHKKQRMDSDEEEEGGAAAGAAAAAAYSKADIRTLMIGVYEHFSRVENIKKFLDLKASQTNELKKKYESSSLENTVNRVAEQYEQIAKFLNGGHRLDFKRFAPATEATMSTFLCTVGYAPRKGNTTKIFEIFEHIAKSRFGEAMVKNLLINIKAVCKDALKFHDYVHHESYQKGKDEDDEDDEDDD